MQCHAWARRRASPSNLIVAQGSVVEVLREPGDAQTAPPAFANVLDFVLTWNLRKKHLRSVKNHISSTFRTTCRKLHGGWVYSACNQAPHCTSIVNRYRYKLTPQAIAMSDRLVSLRNSARLQDVPGVHSGRQKSASLLTPQAIASLTSLDGFIVQARGACRQGCLCLSKSAYANAARE